VTDTTDKLTKGRTNERTDGWMDGRVSSSVRPSLRWSLTLTAIMHIQRTEGSSASTILNSLVIVTKTRNFSNAVS